MSIVLNRTRETTSSTGTGNLTLTGAVSGHQTFNTAIGTNVRFFYWIEDGTAWETGEGYMSASTTFVRETLIASSTGSLLVVTTAAEIYSEAPGSGQMGCFSNVSSRGQSDTYIGPANMAAHATANVAVTTDRVYYIPFLLNYSGATDGIACEIGTGAGTKMRLGLYTVGTDGEPDVLLEESADIDCSTTGIKVFAYTAKNYAAGWYFVGLVCDGAVTFRGYNAEVRSFNSLGVGAFLSKSIPHGYQASASWTTLPSPAALTNLADATTPAVVLRAV